MSASDSDYSIDWLASDDEDESELESDCTQVQAQTTLPRSSSLGSHTCQLISKRNGNKGKEMNKENMSSLGSSPFNCDSSDYSNGGHSHLVHGDQDGYFRISESPRGKKRPAQRERHLTPEQMEKDRLFAFKCLELQCYIQPLSSILNGLRSGRYRERLSTFQESVAMDRIQRIMGVLQNPYMGERYVNIILKMEEMLKNWFPHIKPQRSDQANPATLKEETLPAKKAKFSPTASLLTSVAIPATTSALSMGNKAMRVSDLTPPGPYSATNLKWLHTSPICSLTTDQAQGTVRNFLTAHRERDVTQDNSVSSSTDRLCSKMNSGPSRPPPGKINAPCLERLLKSTESIITQKGSTGTDGTATGRWS